MFSRGKIIFNKMNRNIHFMKRQNNTIFKLQPLKKKQLQNNNHKYYFTTTNQHAKNKLKINENKLILLSNNNKSKGKQFNSILTTIGLTSAAIAYTNQTYAAPSIEEGVNGKKLAMSPINEDGIMPFSLTEPKYDQSTFEGRLKGILLKIDPRNVLISDAELESAQKLLERYKNNTLKEGEVDDATLWKARETIEAVIHKPTGEKMFVLGRMSAFVLCNIPMLIGMMIHGPTSTAAGMFWQWLNQSYNVVNNYTNRAGREVDNASLLKTYGIGVTVACTIVFVSNQLIARVPALKSLGLLIPYLAVASAGGLNVALTRMDEIQNGITVRDASGKDVGISKSAGALAVYKTVTTRSLFLPVAPMLLPPVLMKVLNMRPGNPALAIEIIVIALCMGLALPCALALLPEEMELDVNDLEKEFHNLKDKNGNAIRYLYAAKGL